jgi:hypothetical protein
VKEFARIAVLTLILPAFVAHTENPRGSPGPEEPQTGMITGYVVCDDTRTPARFASVLIIPIPISAQSGKVTVASAPDSTLFARLRRHDVAKTNLDGEYSLTNISPGSYFVLAELDGYLSPVWQFDEDDLKDLTPETFKTATALLPTVQVEAGKTVHADITLERGASISGTVTYEDGSPAIGVAVRLEMATDDSEGKRPLLDGLMHRSMGTSDDHGRYRINGWPGGKYVLGVTLPGNALFSNPIAVASKEVPTWYFAQGGTITIYSEKTFHRKDAKVYTVTEGDDLSGIDVELPLHGLHSISGQVITEGDQPSVVWGFVDLRDINDNKFNGQTVIFADGSFQFFNLPTGSYKLTTRDLSDVVPQLVDSSPEPTHYSYKNGSTAVEVMDKDLKGVAIAIPGSSKPTESPNTVNPNR